MILIFSLVAFLLVLVLSCTYFPIQCYHNLDIDRSLHNIDLAWKRKVDNALLDEVYQNVSNAINSAVNMTYMTFPVNTIYMNS